MWRGPVPMFLLRQNVHNTPYGDDFLVCLCGDDPCAFRHKEHLITGVCILFRAPAEAPPLTISPMSPYGAMRSNLQAVSPRIAARSASLKLGVPRMWSTAVLVHGYG
jgi:hypothetical protein